MPAVKFTERLDLRKKARLGMVTNYKNNLLKNASMSHGQSPIKIYKKAVSALKKNRYEKAT